MILFVLAVPIAVLIFLIVFLWPVPPSIVSTRFQFNSINTNSNETTLNGTFVVEYRGRIPLYILSTSTLISSKNETVAKVETSEPIEIEPFKDRQTIVVDLNVIVLADLVDLAALYFASRKTNKIEIQYHSRVKVQYLGVSAFLYFQDSDTVELPENIQLF
eukprot:gene1750-519_t